MTFRTLSRLSAAALCAAVLAAPAAEPPEEEEGPVAEMDEQPIYDFFHKIDALFSAGETNAATKAFFEADDDPALKPFEEIVRGTRLRFLLFTEQVELAKSTYLGELRTVPDKVSASRDLIYGYLLETGRADEALDWARTLLAQDLPQEMRFAATDWVASRLLAAGDPEGSLAVVTNALATFPPADIGPFCSRIAIGAIASGKADFAQGVADAMRAASPELASAADALGLRLLAAKGDFAGVAAKLPALAEGGSDLDLLQALRYAVGEARRAGDFAAVDAMTAAVVLDERFAKLPRTVQLAAREWAGAVFDGPAAEPARFPERLSRLLSLPAVPPSSLSSIYSRHFYDVIGDKEVLRATLAVGEAIKARLSDPADRALLSTYDLDAAFVLEDYDAALRVLEAGIPDRDAAWHEMAKTKIRAHKALAAKDWAEAVRLFDAFVDMLPEEDQPDPSTGVVHSRLLIVADNKARVAAIWRDAGDAAKAAAASAEAAKLYAEALEANKAGPETADYIRARAKEAEEAAK